MVDALISELFSGSANTYAILDGASVPQLRQALFKMRPEHECLYLGELTGDMAEVAPYLVRLEPDSPFALNVLEQGWGKHWGIFATSEAGIRDLRQHFRRFLTVFDPAGKALLFRYYDPRVLRSYLPTCNPEEVTMLFGPVTAFFAEADQPSTLLRFEHNAGHLVKRQQDLDKK